MLKGDALTRRSMDLLDSERCEVGALSCVNSRHVYRVFFRSGASRRRDSSCLQSRDSSISTKNPLSHHNW